MKEKKKQKKRLNHKKKTKNHLNYNNKPDVSEDYINISSSAPVNRQAFGQTASEDYINIALSAPVNQRPSGQTASEDYINIALSAPVNQRPSGQTASQQNDDDYITIRKADDDYITIRNDSNNSATIRNDSNNSATNRVTSPINTTSGAHHFAKRAVAGEKNAATLQKNVMHPVRMVAGSPITATRAKLPYETITAQTAHAATLLNSDLYISKKIYNKDNVTVSRGIHMGLDETDTMNTDIVFKQFEGNNTDGGAIEHEHKILQQIASINPPCPYLIGYVGFSAGGMITKFCAHGDALNYLKNKQFPSQKAKYLQLLTFSWQLATALEVLHRNDIRHGDIALRNILINTSLNPDTGETEPVVVVTDFDKAHSNVSKRDLGGIIPWQTCSPERIEYIINDGVNLPSAKDDIYASGVVLWHMINISRKPLENVSPHYFRNNTQDFLNRILAHRHNYDTFPAETPAEYSNLAKECWQPGAKRPTPDELRTHSEKIKNNINSGHIRL